MKKLLTTALALSAVSSFAAGSAANFSAIKTGKNLIENFKANGGSVSFFQEWAGSSLGDSATKNTEAAKGWTSISINKAISKSQTIYLNPRFTLTPGDATEDSAVMEEWTAGIKTKRFNNGKLAYKDNIRLYISPTSESSRDNGRIAAPFYGGTLSYTVDSKTNVGADYWARTYLTSQGSTATGEANYHFDNGLEPFITYSLSDKVTLQAIAAIRVTNTSSNNSILKKNGSSLRIGADLALNKKWSLGTLIKLDTDKSVIDSKNQALIIQLAGSIL
jgi:hypothetical protein